jgi:glutaredoxin 3
MAKVTIYTRPFCGYCARALSLLTDKGADFTEVEAGMDPKLRQEMMQHIGGCDDMMALEREGKLDQMLAA